MIKDVSFRNYLAFIEKKVENIHKIASLLNRFCQDNIDDDELYEISGAIEIIEKKLSELGYELYFNTHDIQSSTKDEIAEKIKSLNNAENPEFDDD